MDNVSPQTDASPTGPASSTSTISVHGHQSVPVASFSTAYTGAIRCKKQTRHVRRHMNAFILFSRNERAIVSKYLGKKWNALGHAETQPGVLESKRLGNLQEEQYVDFNYCPKKGIAKPRPRVLGLGTGIIVSKLFRILILLRLPCIQMICTWTPRHQRHNTIMTMTSSQVRCPLASPYLPTEDSSDLDNVAQEDLFYGGGE